MQFINSLYDHIQRDVQQDDQVHTWLIKFAGQRPNIQLIKSIAKQYSIDLGTYIPYNTYLVSGTAQEADRLAATPGSWWW